MSRTKDQIGVSPIGALLAGVVAGAIGTVAMDAFLYRRYRGEGGRSEPIAWETAGGLKDFGKAPVPALVGKRLAEAFLQRELPPSTARLVTNVMHWGYGTAWGGLYGLLVGSGRSRSALLGLPFGALVWGADYALLPLGKFYKPIWQYDLKTLGKDLSAHFVYGVGTSLAFALLDARR